MGNNVKFIAIGSIIFAMMIFITVVLLFVYRPYPRSPRIIVLDRGEMKLVSAIVLFRHGARAPLEFENETIAALFPNGKGEITEIGLQKTFDLGRFLGERYVDTGFLKSPPHPKEIYFRSRANNRCLFCGAIVGSGMWTSQENDEFVAVPIFAQEKNDKILTHLQNCDVEITRINNKCGKMPPSYANWPVYQGFIYECIGLNRENDLFSDATAFSEVEGLVQMDRNGFQMPAWFEKNRELIYSLYEKVFSFVVGVNEYHNSNLLKMKQGFFMSRIMKMMWDRWIEYEKHGKTTKKFVAYSTQDWLLMAFLHSLGCGEEALGSTVPDYNALVMIELYERNQKPMVKVLYKDNSMEVPRDVTHAVRGCTFSPCHLFEFISCCKPYMTEDPKSACDSNSDIDQAL